MYTPVPPDAVTPALPLHKPLHVTFVCAGVNEIAGGWVIVNERVVVHPFASVMVHVNVPAHKPVALAPVPPEGAHEYV